MDTTVRNNPIETHQSGCAVSWTAIVAGALTAISLSFLFNLLNAGLGLVSFPNLFGGLVSLSIGGLLWVILCTIVAMFIAGYVAGKIHRHYFGVGCGGCLHGFLAWSLALLLSLIVAAHFVQAGAHAIEAAKETTTVNIDVGEHGVASERAQTAVSVLGGVTLGAFFTFLLGAAAASVGGHLGNKRD